MAGIIDPFVPPKRPNSGNEAENRVIESVEEGLKKSGVEYPEVPEIEDRALPDELKKHLERMLQDCREEDKDIRDEQLRIWKKLDYYWNNILDIFWDEVARDWRVPTDNDWEELEELPARIINIFRPHGEAIVAALSVTIPSLIFYPDDAESPDDLEMARAARDISDLVSRHNDGPMLFIRAIVVMLNQGTIFGYNYFNQDSKYGTLDRPEISFRDFSFYDVFCDFCGSPIDGMVETRPSEVYDCPNCGSQTRGSVRETKERLPEIVGFNKEPKSSVAQEVYSGLNVKIPMNARKQEECGYLLLEFYQSVAMLRSIFSDNEESAKEIQADYDKGELNEVAALYRNRIPDNSARVSALWLRPYQYWMICNDDEDYDFINELKKRFPSGIYALFVNDKLMEIVEESMDDHWTISKNPLGSTLLARPLAENLATIQDIRAELVELEIETVEHGIPETFVDPTVLDLDKYSKQRSRPGMVTAAKPRSGKTLQEAFHTTKTAILSQEVDPIRQHIDQDAQFSLGSFPSVYGGLAQGGSRTASEYAQSRAMALQRLGTIWKLLCEWYADFQARSVDEYINILREEGRDERFVSKEGNSFVNKWIRLSSLTGRVGRVEPEASEQLPTTWAQKKDVIFQLVQGGIPEILQLLIHPRNIEIVKNAIGLQELYIPGEDARNRQLREFVDMSSGIEVQVNPELDNHEVHAEILSGLLESPLSETLSPEARQICLMHLQAHQAVLAERQLQEQMMNQQAATPAKKERPNVR